MGANRQYEAEETVPSRAFAQAFRRLQGALTAHSEEKEIARALCRFVRQTPGVTSCAVRLEGDVSASTSNWRPNQPGGKTIRLTGGAGLPGSLQVAVSDPEKWALFEPYVASAARLVGLRLENLRLERELDQVKQNLARKDELTGYLIEHVRSGVAVLDRDLRYIYVSRRFLEELDMPEADVIGKRHYDVFPDLPESWKDVHRRAFKGEVSSAETDPYERADGVLYWTRWECRPWYEAGGAVGGLVLYTEVINEKLEAEEERRGLQAQLAQAQKMESIGRLAGGVAHDFNNLLTVINGYSSMALDQLKPGDPLREELEEIRKSGERAASLTRQLLAFSRKQVLQPRLLDLNEVIRELQPMLLRLMGERVRVRASLDRDRLPVFADRHQIEQVIMNLAVNARDAMPGGGDLAIETARLELDEAGAKERADAKPGSYAALTVQDTGVGMNPQTRLRIFEPFFTTKQSGRGTGLGLAMVHGIVAQSGGFIDVVSEPGKGSSFTVHLPAAEAGAPGTAPAEEAPVTAGGEETIFVVEDQAEVRKYAADALTAYGYRVVSCGSAAEALALCEKPDQAVDLVVTDLVMPDMGGRELGSRLAELRPDIPVIFMSGYSGDTIEDQDQPPGALFLQKPFSPAELAGKVRYALNSARKSD